MIHLAVDAGVVGDQPDPFAGNERLLFGEEDLQAGNRLAKCRDGAEDEQ